MQSIGTLLFVGLVIIFVIALLYKLFKKKEEDVVEEEDTTFFKSEITISSKGSQKKTYRAVLKPGASGHNRNDWDYYDGMDLIEDLILMDLLFDSFDIIDFFDSGMNECQVDDEAYYAEDVVAEPEVIVEEIIEEPVMVEMTGDIFEDHSNDEVSEMESMPMTEEAPTIMERPTFDHQIETSPVTEMESESQFSIEEDISRSYSYGSSDDSSSSFDSGDSGCDFD